MNEITRLVGTHHALKEAIKLDEFESWLSHNEDECLDQHFEGYKILLRAVFRTFVRDLKIYKESFGINSSIEYERAESSIADIDSLNAESEASHLIKNLNEIDRRLYRAHNKEYLVEELQSVDEKAVQPFKKLFEKYGRTKTKLDLSTYFDYRALETLLDAANDASRGYPEAYQTGWIDGRYTLEEFNSNVESYALALRWLYSKLCVDAGEMEPVHESLKAASDWDDLDKTYKTNRVAMVDPLENTVDTRIEGYEIEVPDSATEIDHLLTNAPDPAVGIEKTLDRLFLWEDAQNADQVLYGSGIAGFEVILRGLLSVREQIGVGDPIQIRRLIHPDEPGNNYSYAIEQAGWTPNNSGSLSGWSVFVRKATDYSGFGSQQYSLIENRLGGLSDQGAISIKELEVKEEALVSYLNDQRSIKEHYARSDTDTFDNRRLERIIEGGEDTRTEFKQEFLNSMIENGKEISALANYDGGILIYGVTDDGTVVGIEDQEEIENQISGILWDMMDPPLSADLYQVTYENKPIVIVDIPEADQPVGCNYVYYYRNGTQVRKLTFQEMKRRFG